MNIELTPTHQNLINEILNQRDADYRNHVAEADESLQDFPKVGEVRNFTIYRRGRAVQVERMWNGQNWWTV